MSEPEITPEMVLEERRVIVGESAKTLARTAAAITADDGNPFGDLANGPRTPDLTSARSSPEVQKAMDSLKAASAEIGTVRTLEAVVRFVCEEFGIKIGE